MSFLGMLLSPWAVLAWLGGLVLFIAAPLVAGASNNEGIPRWYLGLATMPLKRAAILLSEHGDTTFSTMSFDALGMEQITIDKTKKFFGDPDDALHYWNGIPFALADEKHGFLFDPRHAAIGAAKHALRQEGNGPTHASMSEWENYGVDKWVPGVLPTPAKPSLVNLGRVRELAYGGERAEYPQRTKDLYELLMSPFGEGVKPSRVLWLIAAFLGPFAAIWILSSQLGGGNVPSDSVSFVPGMATFTLLFGVATVKRYAWLPLLLAVAAGLTFLVGPFGALALLLSAGIGFIMVPLLARLSKPISPIAGAFSNLFFRLGFFGFRRPVFYWQSDKYVVREADEIDNLAGAEWYGLKGTVVGFSYDPEDAWGPGEVSDVSALQDVGRDAANVPAGYEPASALDVDTYGGFVPKRPKDDRVYLRNNIATGRFDGAAEGTKSLEKLGEAKPEHGGTSGMAEDTYMKLTAAAALVSFIAGIGLFVA
jgi:hypothetical protein